MAPMKSWDWANAAYLLSHFVGEFLIKNQGLVPLRPPDAHDDGVLAWLLSNLHRFHAEDRETSRSNASRHPTSEQKLWVLAAAAYALIICGVITQPDLSENIKRYSDPEQVEAKAARQLREIRVWWEEKMAAWNNTELPSGTLISQILEKVAWMTSKDGEFVVEHLRRRCLIGTPVFITFSSCCKEG